MGTVHPWQIILTCGPAWGSRENRLSDPKGQSQGQLWTGVFTIFQNLPKISHLFLFSTIGIKKTLKIKGPFQAWAIDVIVKIISRSATATFVCGWTLKAVPYRNTCAHCLWVWAFLLPIRCITKLLLMGPLCIQQKYFWSSPGSHNICWVHI